jgi:signal peptidase I
MRVVIKFILSFGLIIFTAAKPFSQNLQTTIKVQAMDMANALIKNDFIQFIKYMDPKIIEFIGGREKFKANMDTAAIKMKQFGAAFKKILIGNPGEIIGYKGQLQCVLPESTDIESLLGTISAQTTLIAISVDNGKNWYFIDTSIYRVDKIKSLMPDLSPKLIIPPQQQLVFTPKKN